MTIKLTADQWELYTASMKCGTAARGLNAAANAAVKSAQKAIGKGSSIKTATLAAIDDAMRAFGKYRAFGAADSEPLGRLEYEVCKALGLDYNDLF